MMIPIGVTLKYWWDSLVIDFPNDNIPILDDEKDWKEKGSFLVQEIDFAIQNAPSSVLYEDPFDWAMDVYRSMNNF